MTTDREDGFPGSRVMPVCSSVDFDELLDELELRLMRSSSRMGAYSGTLRRGSLLAAGEQATAIARNETRGFWHSHRLERTSLEVASQLVGAMLTRPPRYLAWALVPLVTELRTELLSDSLVPRIVDWLTQPEPVDRVVRDTIALTIVVHGVSHMPEDAALEQLTGWCNAGSSVRARMGFVAMASWIKGGAPLAVRTLDDAFGVCFGSSRRRELDVAMAVGWALRELLLRDGERLLPRFERQASQLSRHAFRTAVGRLPARIRIGLVRQWMAEKRGDRATGTEGKRPRRQLGQ